MRTAMILALTLAISACIAYASGAGSEDIDIVGSKLSNIQIFSSGDGFSDLEKKLDIVGSKLENIEILSEDSGSQNIELVGSTLKNIKISPPEETSSCYWYPSCITQPPPSCIKPHLGVDAWYGQYWYTETYTPKWPRVF